MGSGSGTALTPLSFLEKVCPRVAGGLRPTDGRPRLTYAGLAAEVEQVARARTLSQRGRTRRPGCSTRCRICPRCSSPISRCHWRAGCSSRSTPGSPHTRCRTSCVTEGSKTVVADTALLATAVTAVADVDTVTRLVVAADTQAGPAGADPVAESRLV